jgi:hypothetical protein
MNRKRTLKSKRIASSNRWLSSTSPSSSSLLRHACATLQSLRFWFWKPIRVPLLRFPFGQVVVICSRQNQGLGMGISQDGRGVSISADSHDAATVLRSESSNYVQIDLWLSSIATRLPPN